MFQVIGLWKKECSFRINLKSLWNNCKKVAKMQLALHVSLSLFAISQCCMLCFSKLHHIHFFKLESFLGTIYNGFFHCTRERNHFCRSNHELKILLHYTCFCSKYILKLSSYDYSFNQTHIIWLRVN